MRLRVIPVDPKEPPRELKIPGDMHELGKVRLIVADISQDDAAYVQFMAKDLGIENALLLTAKPEDVALYRFEVEEDG